MAVKLTLSLLVAVLAVGLAANILDFFNFDDGKKLIEVPETREQPNRNCMCKGPACVCCVNFNITIVELGGPGKIVIVELGGPGKIIIVELGGTGKIIIVELEGQGCVHMKYVSPEEGFSVKVSYGKNLIHNSKIQVFGRFAQVCAKFHDLAPTSDGLRGCLELQPKLLGETQLDFPIGCFKSTAGEEEEEEEEAEDDKDTFDVESFLHGVYQTAEQGVALLSTLLDIPRNSTTTTTTPKPEDNRRGKNLKHPNQL
ncbi:Uncharacterized protein OBRU01_08862 [Operophtera brumata]|uniref:DUF4773 domain-containing protein n=1 Tax=Operophtera brumata TaxID=104452 RepID=A0A0L7LGD0_OPEBR|nr:Uncharacterized protein OBRU01_08862 [Operophtera brumata]